MRRFTDETTYSFLLQPRLLQLIPLLTLLPLLAACNSLPADGKPPSRQCRIPPFCETDSIIAAYGEAHGG